MVLGPKKAAHRKRAYLSILTTVFGVYPDYGLPDEQKTCLILPLDIKVESKKTEIKFNTFVKELYH